MLVVVLLVDDPEQVLHLFMVRPSRVVRISWRATRDRVTGLTGSDRQASRRTDLLARLSANNGLPEIPAWQTAGMAASRRSVIVDMRTRRAGGERGSEIPDGPDPLLRKIYGEILRDERLDQDRTLDDVARAVGMSKQYLSEVERGRKEPSSEMLHSVCDALGLPIEHLLTRAVRRITASRRIATRRPSDAPQVKLLAA